MTKDLLVVLSGGLDSTVLLWYLKTQNCAARAVTIDYGQRHRREIEAARRVALLANLPHDVVDLSTLGHLLPGSSQTDPAVEVPIGHYEDATMRRTVVANRNMILLSVCLGIAVARGLSGVAYGAHAGDHAIYPDCRPAFVDAMREAAALCDYQPRKIVAPFVGLTKTQIVTLGLALGAPLVETWTCYVGGTKHCGRCGACNERREAFQLAGRDDPTEYA